MNRIARFHQGAGGLPLAATISVPAASGVDSTPPIKPMSLYRVAQAVSATTAPTIRAQRKNPVHSDFPPSTDLEFPQIAPNARRDRRVRPRLQPVHDLAGVTALASVAFER
jgi:hypothetical protein